MRSGAHGAHDIDVARAHAEIAAEADAYFLVRRIRVVPQQLESRQDHSGSAKAALERVVLLKRLLQRMERLIRREPFNGENLFAVGLGGKEQTGTNRATIEQHRAGAAHAVLAADVGSDQAEIMAQKIDERATRLDRSRLAYAVDNERNRNFFSLMWQTILLLGCPKMIHRRDTEDAEKKGYERRL